MEKEAAKEVTKSTGEKVEELLAAEMPKVEIKATEKPNKKEAKEEKGKHDTTYSLYLYPLINK